MHLYLSNCYYCKLSIVGQIDLVDFNKKLGDSTDLHEIFIYFEDVGIESDVIQ